ncbi:hypothetical protein [Nitrosomonas halophila]|uniref:hypothetical protein n=1 Tax=Nitrosomonas halophila TaxID=44576 RepID=UPI0015A1F5C7|nr:hypothetical protein [Nitrosomonas halophila]
MPKKPESGKIRTTSKPSSYISLYLASTKFAFISLSMNKKTSGFLPEVSTFIIFYYYVTGPVRETERIFLD